MKIVIETIPHQKQRYSTVGDYWVEADGTHRIVVSDMGNEQYALLVAVHELVEQALCEARSISEESISAFDIAFEAKRAPENNDEPGDDPLAPYQNEHNIATSVERLLCASLGIKWSDYDKAAREVCV